MEQVDEINQLRDGIERALAALSDPNANNYERVQAAGLILSGLRQVAPQVDDRCVSYVTKEYAERKGIRLLVDPAEPEGSGPFGF